MFRVFYTPIIRCTIFNRIYSHWYKPQYPLSYLFPVWPGTSVPSSGIKLTAYSCICWLFHRIYYDARNHKHKIHLQEVHTFKKIFFTRQPCQGLNLNDISEADSDSLIRFLIFFDTQLAYTPVLGRRSWWAKRNTAWNLKSAVPGLNSSCVCWNKPVTRQHAELHMKTASLLKLFG